MSKKRIAFALAVLGALAILAAPALADGLVTINAGGKSVTDGGNVDFGAFTASFVSQTSAAKFSPALWSVTDLSDDGAGWNVTVAATNFVNGGNTIPVTLAAQTVKVNLATATITCTAGACTALCAPVSTVFGGASDYLSNAAPLKVFHNTLAGSCVENGTWTFNPAFTLKIPAGALPGSYVSTWTVTIADGP